MATVRKICGKGTTFCGHHYLFVGNNQSLDRKLGHTVKAYDIKSSSEVLIEEIDVLNYIEGCIEEYKSLAANPEVLDEDYTHYLGDGTAVIGKRVRVSEHPVEMNNLGGTLKWTANLPYFDLEYYLQSNDEMYYTLTIGAKHLRLESNERCFYVTEWSEISGRRSSKDKVTKIVYGRSL